TAFFTSRREGGFGDADIYEARFNHSTHWIARYYLHAGSTRAPNDELQISLIDPQTGALEGLYNLRKGYSSGILLVEKRKKYELRAEGGQFEPLIIPVSFQDNQTDVQLNLKSKYE